MQSNALELQNPEVVEDVVALDLQGVVVFLGIVVVVVGKVVVVVVVPLVKELFESVAVVLEEIRCCYPPLKSKLNHSHQICLGL